jgi:hypothetical protein
MLEIQALKDFDVENIVIDKNFLFNIENKQKDNCKSQEERGKLLLIKDKPVLYWFTFPEGFQNQETIRNSFMDFSIKNNKKEYSSYEKDYKVSPLKHKRALSAIKNKFLNQDTNTLYVGKVKKDFWGRLATHSGWATSPKTAGLQLAFWYNFENFPPIKLNYITFEKEMDDFVSILEIELAKELKPLIGKK